METRKLFLSWDRNRGEHVVVPYDATQHVRRADLFLYFQSEVGDLELLITADRINNDGIGYHKGVFKVIEQKFGSLEHMRLLGAGQVWNYEHGNGENVDWYSDGFGLYTKPEFQSRIRELLGR